ncbi:hypothetical protein SAMD00023353_0701740 [Rosellinia necatrix]|uniref:Gpi anchored protein n=1 Tax=Rosellinia necatrix TaxID=77044 RepID=A0A1S7ULZ1_ROSNE|nr:hypothetical protein SAMD00023353_0701740 [Rosellinia necatrix]
MRAQTGFLTLFPVLRSVTALYTLPEPPQRRDGDLEAFYNMVGSDVLKRSTSDATFPLNFGLVDQVLAEGDFGGVELSVTCVECLVTGEVIASAMLPDLSDIDITYLKETFSDAMIGLTFNGVNATVDVDITAAASGEFAIPLLTTQTPIGVSGFGFELGVSFGLDLVFTIAGKIETGGGFKVIIPDGSSFMVPFNDANSNFANFNGASASLLPITIDLPVEITAALRLNVEGGVSFPDLGFIEARARAGAFLAIPEVILTGGASLPNASSSSCVVPVSAELNINAGVFVDISADVAGDDIVDFNPTAATTFFAVSTSTCLKTAGGDAIATPSSAAAAAPHASSFPLPASWRPTPSAGSAPQQQQTTLATVHGVAPAVTLAAEAHTQQAEQQGAYPLTLRSLATPITNYATAAAITAAPAVSVAIVR